MAAARKTFFLAPDLTFPPDGPIRLGVILPNPSCPSHAINLDSVVRIDEEVIYSTQDMDWKFSHETKKKSGAFARAPATMFPASQDNRSSQTFHIDQFDQLTTKYFYPSNEYVAKSMASESVLEYVQQKRFGASLYMVTGVKIASKGTKFHGVYGNIDGAAVGAPPGVVAQFSKGEEISSQTSSEIVFAYSLRRIVYSRLRGGFPAKSYTKGARFSTDADLWNMKDDEDDDEYEAQSQRIDVLGLEKHDSQADDFDLSSTDLVDDDNAGEELNQSCYSGPSSPNESLYHHMRY